MTGMRVLSMVAPMLFSLAWFAPAASPPIPVTITLAASSVVGGNGTTATLVLGTPAPTGGAIVTVTNPVGTTVQAGANQVGTIQTPGSTKINIAAGQRQVTFNVLTVGVAATSVATLTATSGSNEAAVALVVTPAAPRSLTITPSAVTGGQSASMSIVLDGAAPAGTGVDVFLSTVGQTAASGDASVRTVSPSPALVPPTIHFPAGASSMSIPITTTAVTRDQPTTIRATLGAATVSTIITVKAPVVTALSLAPTAIMRGSSTTGTVSLNGPAPANGLSVSLVSNNAATTIPRTVTVPAGATAVTFSVTTSTPVGALLPNDGPGGVATAIIGAEPNSQSIASGAILDGTSNTIQFGESRPVASATLTILPTVVLQSASVAPISVTGGDPFTLSLTLTTGAISIQAGSGAIAFGNAPSVVAGTAAIGVDQPSLVQIPSSVTVSSGGGVVTVHGTTTASTADATVTIKTAFGPTTVTTMLLVKAPVAALASFTARPTTVTGGNNLIVSLKLSASISSATVVTLSTDRPDLIQVPASATVSASAVATPLTFKTQPVTTQTTATITALAGTQRIPLTITLVP